MSKIKSKFPRVPLDLTDRLVFISGVIAILIILFYKLVFLTIEEIFPKAFEVGEIFYNVLLSIVGSAFFYFFGIYLEKRRQKLLIEPIIKAKTGSLNLDSFFILKNIYEFKRLPVIGEFPTLEEFNKVCKGISLRGPCPLIFNNPPYQPKNWFDYFSYFFSMEQENIDLLYKHFPFTSPEILIKLDEIRLNNLHRALALYINNPQYDDMANLSGPLWNHLNLLRLVGQNSKVIKNKILNR